MALPFAVAIFTTHLIKIFYNSQVKHANEVGYPERKSSMLLVYIGIASLIGKVTAGRMLDSPRFCVFWISQISGYITSLSLVVLTFAYDDKSFISFAIVYGVGNGLFVSSMFSLWLTTVTPEQRPLGLATGEVFAAIGVLTGSPFIGISKTRCFETSTLIYIKAQY